MNTNKIILGKPLRRELPTVESILYDKHYVYNSPIDRLNTPRNRKLQIQLHWQLTDNLRQQLGFILNKSTDWQDNTNHF